MYFSRAELVTGAATTGELAALAGGGNYRLHQMVWRLFPANEDQGRDFLYRWEDAAAPRLYLVSERPPALVEGPWKLETKPYTPAVQQGELLQFSLRANPVRTRKAAEGRSKRHDVVMDAKWQQRQAQDEPAQAMTELIHQVGREWLAGRAEGLGFSVQDCPLRVEGYRQHRLFKARTGKPVRFSTLEFSGVLRVVDRELFVQTLFRGVGPAKGFGCGLLMVRRG